MNSDDVKGPSNHSTQGGDHHEHLMQPISTFVKVFAALIALTILTVVTSLFDFGVMNIVVAMLIAATKAILVALFFMQLKFDELGNKVTFLAAFVFLAIFILLTGSDLFFRHPVEPLKIEASANQGETDQNKLRVATPQLVARGKEIFGQQCVSCHGVDGKGDGPAAAGLNPPPRNYTSGYWRYGGAPTQIFHTLTVGSPGTAMAAYNNLSIEDRYALAHYVRSLSPNHPDDTPETLKAAGLTGDGKGVVAQEVEPEPIDVAMQKIETDPDQIIFHDTDVYKPDSVGARLYIDNHCVTCHGVNGRGVQSKAMGNNPLITLTPTPWPGLNVLWAKSPAEFIKVTSEHVPGFGGPGIATLSRDEWQKLYDYAREIVQLKK